jgi:predicted transcriptional regulator YdeE
VPRLVTHTGTTVVGIGVVTSNAAEGDPATGQIGRLWTRFHQENVLDKIPGKKIPAAPVAVYTDYESDHTGAYRLIVGAAVLDDSRTAIPEGLRRAVIPAGTYLMFEAQGDMPSVVVETWQAIWSHFSDRPSHVRAYATDFEMYPAPNAVEIYISIR